MASERSNMRAYASVVFIATLVGTLVAVELMRLYTYRHVHRTFGAIDNIFRTASTLRYGVIDSVDIERRTVVIRISDPFAPGGTKLLSLAVDKTAFIAQQELQGSGEVYDSLSTQTPASLQDLRVGMRAAIGFGGRSDKLVASVILFGNPL